MEKKKRLPKTVGSRYVVKVNNEMVETRDSRKEAMDYIRTIPLDNSIQVIELTRETLFETPLYTFKPKLKVEYKLTSADDIDFDVDDESLDDEEIL